MNWFKGSIAEAVTVSKQKNATFVVYIEGKDENSQKLTGFLNQPVIKEKLEQDCFVAVKIEGGSEAYMQFARIYQIVPLPSVFFIGKNGTPLEIATGIINSAEELNKKIDNVLKLTGASIKNSAASASADFISGEQKSQASEAPTTSTPTEPAKNKTNPSETAAPSIAPKPVEDVASSKPKQTDATSVTPVCKDGVCTMPDKSAKSPTATVEVDKVPQPSTSKATPAANTPTSAPPTSVAAPTPAATSTPSAALTQTTVSSPTPVPTPAVVLTSTVDPTSAASTSAPSSPSEETSPAVDEQLEQAKKLIEERRKLKQAEEDRQERERELSRRKDGKNTQNFQQWQKEQDFKELKESIRRDRLEDQAARQRILEQIASDRAERAQKFTPPAATSAAAAQQPSPSTTNPPSSSDMSRIQFRIPNGETETQSFESSDTFATVRAYVKGSVIKGTGIKDFTLATTFPKHEFTAEDDAETLQALGLCPNAVILVIAKASSGPAAVVARSGGVINIFNTLFWALLTPIVAIFGYIRGFIIGRNDGPPDARPTTTGAQKRSNEERVDANDLAKKRNLDRYRLTKDGPSTSKEAIATAASTNSARRRVGGSNIHRLSDQRKDSDDENNTWNGNSTQQQ